MLTSRVLSSGYYYGLFGLRLEVTELVLEMVFFYFCIPFFLVVTFSAWLGGVLR